MKKLLILWLYLSISGFSAGNDTTFVKTLKLKEIVVQSFGLNKPVKDIGIPIHLTDKSAISLFPAGDLSPVLNTIPGIYLQSGTQQTIKLTIRGIGSRSPYSTNRIRAYLNDIPLTNGDGTSILDDIDLFAIENIETVKGSQSAWYGAGLGGSIRLNTEVKPDRKSTSDITFNSGSFGTYKIAGKAALGYDKGYFRLMAGRTAGEGYRQNSSFYRNTLMINGQHGRFKYLLTASDVKAFTPSSIDSLTFANNPSTAAANWLNIKGFKQYKRILSGITYENRITDHVSHQFILSGSFYDQYELRPFNILDDVSGMFQMKDQLHLYMKNYTLSGGIEYLNDTYNWQIFQHDGTESENSQENRTQLNGFIHLNARFNPKLQLNLAAVLHHNKYLRPQQSTDNTIFAPAMTLNYKYSSLVQFYLHGGKGFSNPTVEESLSSDGQMNSQLKPETGWSIDAGLNARSLDGFFTFQLAAYQIWLNDLLVTRRPAEDTFYGENGGKSLFRGVETDLKYRPLKGINAGISGSVSQNTFIDFVHNNSDYTGNTLPGIPSLLASAYLQATLLPQLTGSIFYRYNGSQYADDANLVSVPAWQTIDLQFSSGFLILKKWRTNFTFCIKNVLNASYTSMILINAPTFTNRPPRYYYPGLPRNYQLNLQFSL